MSYSMPGSESEANSRLARLDLSKCQVGGKAWKDKVEFLDRVERLAALQGWKLDRALLEPMKRIAANRQEIHGLKQQLKGIKND